MLTASEARAISNRAGNLNILIPRIKVYALKGRKALLTGLCLLDSDFQNLRDAGYVVSDLGGQILISWGAP